MPITPYLDGQQFDAETKRVMGVAFETARVALRLDRDHPTIAIIARKIIELANAGEMNPDLLAEQALASLTTPSPPVGRLSWGLRPSRHRGPTER